jgi:hypothetical protein
MCNILRRKTSVLSSPVFVVYLDKNERFFMAVKRKPKTFSPNYIITMDPDNFETINNKFFIGRVKSNVLGTIFDIWNTGRKIEKAKTDSDIRISRGCVTYVTLPFKII